MLRFLLLIVAAATLPGCATLLNSNQTRVSLYTAKPASIIYMGDTLATVNDKVTIRVERDAKNLKVVLLEDSVSKPVTIPSNMSFAWYSNILFNYGLGMLVDARTPKRFGYQRHAFLTSNPSSAGIARIAPYNKKGDLYLHLSLPHVNYFSLYPQSEGRKEKIGFWGITGGLDYFHRHNQFVQLSITGAMDFFFPVPAAIDISGEYELMSTLNVSLTNNHRIRRWKLGYGLSLARNSWEWRYYPRWNPPPPTRTPVTKQQLALGLALPVYYQLGRSFHLGFVYRPSFYRPGANQDFKYEHVASLDFCWKLKLR